jgi:hypothetical protein
MTDTRIVIASDFSKYPAGRFESDGPFSGEAFRKKLLVPALKVGRVIVVLDGTLGYGSSFLEEAFGGLVRIEGFDAKSLKDKIEIVSADDPSLASEVWSYIDEAKPGERDER